LPYLEKVRAYGAGDVRIGTKLDMDEDIYSLAFVSMLSDECITPYFDVITGELINLSDSDSEEEEKPHSEQKSSLAQPIHKVKEEKQDEFTLEL
jgi:hypothetical protein